MKKLVIVFCVFICLLILSVIIYKYYNSNKNNIEKTTPQNTEIKSRDSITSTTTTAFFKDFYPTSTYGEVVKHQYYTLSYSEKDEQAEWVAYKLTPASFTNIKRADNFREDSSVTTGSATLDDYKNSGYDRGHLAPAADMSINSTAMSESFFMSNMSPQVASFNRGIWKNLETQVRIWAKSNDSLYVVLGPILDHPIKTIGTNKVTVPRAYYKTIVIFKNGNINGIAFLMPNEKSAKTISFFATSIDDVEALTGIDFYHNLAITIQSKIEANKDLKAGF